MELRNKLAPTSFKTSASHGSIFENLSTDKFRTGTSSSSVEFEVVNISFSDCILLIKVL